MTVSVPEPALSKHLAAQLERGLTSLKIQAGREAIDRLLHYLELMLKWNKVYNLTAIRDADRMVSHHLLDSVAILPHVRGGSVLDVGTGPGLPGIPLAVLRPGIQVTLLDSNQKKTAFLRQVVGELGLHNAEVVCERVETWPTGRRFETITSRAFSELADFVTAAGRLLADGGCFAAMKGVYPQDEIERLPPNFQVQNIVELHIPGVDAARHLVLIGRT